MEHWDTFDPRARYTYEAICTSDVMCNPQPGRGMAYMAVFQDQNQEWLKGEHTYRLRVNDDGSLDVLYGPESPGAEWETNWIKTIPGKGWFVCVRLYGVEQPFFDKTWQLPLIEPIDFSAL